MCVDNTFLTKTEENLCVKHLEERPLRREVRGKYLTRLPLTTTAKNLRTVGGHRLLAQFFKVQQKALKCKNYGTFTVRALVKVDTI